ncbi:MAG: hypothetical protein WAW88_07425 [Nocardioides sp.]
MVGGDVRLWAPVAAIGLADRTRPVGLFDERTTLSYFATSALDGRSSWLRLPGLSLKSWGLDGGVTVSPDGRWLGWVRSARGQAGIAGWSILDTTTGEVRHLTVEGYDRVRPTMSELAFSGDSRYLLATFETPDQPKHGTRGHQFVAWRVSDGRPSVLEPPGSYWLPQLGYADNAVVWSRKHKVFRADPDSRATTTLVFPRNVLMASFAPEDAAFAYIGRDDREKGDPPPDDGLYVGATASGAFREINLPDTSPIGEFLAWRDARHVVLGNFRREVYVVDISDGSHETIDLGGTGEQINTPTLAAGLWAKPLRPAADPTGTSDPRRPWRWAGFGLFVVLLGAGAWQFGRANRSEGRDPDMAPFKVSRGGSPAQTGAVSGVVPTAAWAMAWLFLVGQLLALAARGPTSAELPWMVASMATTAVVVRWFADGVLRARAVRLIVVWILLSATTCLDFVGLHRGADAAPVLAFALSVSQLIALAVFVTTDYFKERRSRPDIPRSALAPLLMIAIATGLLGGLTAPHQGEANSMQLRVGLF